MFSLSSARNLFVLVFLMGVSGLTHAAYSQIISFGDSLSDTGNVLAATGTPTAPYYDGNYSNGPVWVEVMAAQLGLSAPTPSQGPLGTNYAWGGARTTTDGFVPSTQTQVATYLGDTGGVADPNAIYTILTGGNDVQAFDGVTYSAPELIADGQAVATLANDLLLAGAQNILILNIPDLGTAPIADGNEALATYFTSTFNDALLSGITTLGSENVMFLDIFSMTQDIVADPLSYGLTNVDDNCLVTTGGGPVCDSYLFWDDLHPTAAGHELLGMAAASAVSAVPVPAAAWLFGSALLGLVGLGRRR